MDIFIYSDESGVFDNKHYDYFVFGGLIFLNSKEKNNATNKYISVEKKIRNRLKLSNDVEIKASFLHNHINYKRWLYNTLSKYYKFGVVIKLKEVYPSIYITKESKRRHLDYAFKIALKEELKYLSSNNIIILDDIVNINIYVDEHSTATNGIYDLRNGILNELKYGTYNMQFNNFYKPIIPKLNSLNLQFVNSKKSILVRASDIIANKIYSDMLKNKPIQQNLYNHIIYLP